LIQIQVSNAFIERLRSAGIWFLADWKELVWTCRQEIKLPPKFDYLRTVDLIKGHICTGMTRTIARIAAADVQTRISRDQLIHCPSTRRPAIQWMFWKPETLELLAGEIRGKMHIEITAAAS
jgi:hypothetical protein